MDASGTGCTIDNICEVVETKETYFLVGIVENQRLSRNYDDFVAIVTGDNIKQKEITYK